MLDLSLVVLSRVVLCLHRSSLNTDLLSKHVHSDATSDSNFQRGLHWVELDQDSPGLHEGIFDSTRSDSKSPLRLSAFLSWSETGRAQRDHSDPICSERYLDDDVSFWDSEYRSLAFRAALKMQKHTEVLRIVSRRRSTSTYGAMNGFWVPVILSERRVVRSDRLLGGYGS